METKRFIEVFYALKRADPKLKKGDFAKSIGITPQSFTEILGNRMRISTGALGQFIKKYYVNPEYIFNGTLPMFVKPPMISSEGDAEKNRKSSLPQPENSVKLTPTLSPTLSPTLDNEAKNQTSKNDIFTALLEAKNTEIELLKARLQDKDRIIAVQDEKATLLNKKVADLEERVKELEANTAALYRGEKKEEKQHLQTRR